MCRSPVILALCWLLADSPVWAHWTEAGDVKPSEGCDLSQAAIGLTAVPDWSPAMAARSHSTRATLPSEQPGLRSTTQKLPLHFVKNVGQLDKSVKYYASTRDSMVYFTNEGVYFAFIRYEQPANAEGRRNPPELLRSFLLSKDRKVQQEVIRLSALGASRKTTVSGEGLQPGYFNYFIGNDPKKWRTKVSAYSSVVYKDLYPGIDLKFYSRGSDLEYDVVLKPGADLQRAKLAYEGNRSLKLSGAGDLVVELRHSQIIQRMPRIYQMMNGKDVPVEGSFRIIPKQRKDGSQFAYGFDVTSYDRQRPLIIDPQIAYSSFLGGSLQDVAGGVAVDSTGAAYVVGRTSSPDFPSTLGAFDLGIKPNAIMGFVTKISPDDSNLVYSTFLGGSYTSGCGTVVVDLTGATYLGCGTQDTDFPTVHPFQSRLGGGGDLAIVKLSSDGSTLLYSTYFGGSGDESAAGIAVDGSGNIFIAAATNSTDFPIVNAIQPVYGGGSFDGFVAELNPAGDGLIYSSYLGGSEWDKVRDVAIDPSGAVYLAGQTYSPDFPTTPGALQTIFQGIPPAEDAFVTKIASGGGLQYSTYLGGTGHDAVIGIAVDANAAAYVAGQTSSADFPLVNPIQGTLDGFTDAFVSKLSADGSFLMYSTFLGGNSDDWGEAIAVDSTGSAYVVGEEDGDFPTLDPLPVDCGLDGFVTKLDPQGSAWIYSTCLGGNWLDGVFDIAVDPAGAAYVVGYTYSPDFPVHNAVQPYFMEGEHDGFLTKLQCESIDDPQALENSGSAVFTVHLCVANALDAGVDYATADGTAVAGTNYAATSGTLLIPAGSHDATIAVPLIDDGIPDGRKTFFLNLSNPVNVTLSKSQGTATILDGDSLFSDAFDTGVVDWVTKGEWHEGGGILRGSSTHSATAFARMPWFPSGASGCSVCTIEAYMQTSGGLYNKVFLEGWFSDESNKVELIMMDRKGKWVLKQRSGGVVVAKAHTTTSIAPGTSYHVKLAFDGIDFTLFIDGAQVLTLKAGAPASGNVGFKVKKTTAAFGPIRVY